VTTEDDVYTLTNTPRVRYVNFIGLWAELVGLQLQQGIYVPVHNNADHVLRLESRPARQTVRLAIIITSAHELQQCT